ncbi:MAG: hypothetical protein ABI151_09320 [Chitinophagaceae bacterium]
MKITVILLLLLATHASYAQDYSGIWRGVLTQEPGGCFPEYYIELQLEHDGGIINGTSYDYYDSSKFVKLQFSGRLNTSTKRMVIMENEVLRVQIPKDCVPCIKTYDLTWHMEGKNEMLLGTWTGKEMSRGLACPPGKITLSKVPKSAFKQEEVVQNDRLASIQKTLKPETRKVEIIQTLILDTSRIKLELYDNGQIDGDTISIYLNQKLILYRNGLTEKPITINLPVLPNKDYEMIMFAENLGTIPPNTALMVVTAGKKKYEIYLSSSEKKSAAIRFRYEKKE